MPTETAKTVYTFAELKLLVEAGELPQSALDKARQFLDDTDESYWSEYAIETWTSALEQIGFSEVDIRFSGFCSQGDGASFSAKYVDSETLIDFLSTARDSSESITVDSNGKEDFRGWILNRIGWTGIDFNHRWQWLSAFADTLDIRCTRGHSRYVHENTCELTIDDNYGHTELVSAEIESLQQFADDFRREVSQAIYSSLEEEYEYIRSDEYIQETAEANGWKFDCSGNAEH